MKVKKNSSSMRFSLSAVERKGGTGQRGRGAGRSAMPSTGVGGSRGFAREKTPPTTGRGGTREAAIREILLCKHSFTFPFYH